MKVRFSIYRYNEFMDALGDLLQKKAENLDTSVGDDLKLIQIELDRLFGEGVARARSISDRAALIITTTDSSKMTTIRYAHTQIMAAIRNQTDRNVVRIVIRIE